MTKKLLSLLVAALMIMALVPMSIFAKSETQHPVLSDRFAPNVRFDGVNSNKVKKQAAAPVETRDPEYICDGSVYSYGFETTFNTDEGWWTYDQDSTNYSSYDNWTQVTAATSAYEGSGSMASYSYNPNTQAALNQTNWLITKEITIPDDSNTYYLSFWAKSQDASFLDAMYVSIAEAGTNAYNAAAGTVVRSRWTTIMAKTTIPADYTNYMIDLSNYKGKTVSFAFIHNSNDMFILRLDYVQVGQRVEVINETGITLDNTSLALEVTYGEQITATVTPSDATYSDVTWTSSNTNVVAVNNAGGILAMAAGSATITATTHHGLTATCTVTVTEGDAAYDTEMMAYSVYDLEADSTPDMWYNMNQYGVFGATGISATELIRSEYDAADGKIYGFDGSYNFISLDTNNNYAATTIASLTKDDMPMWMAYDFETDTMYGCYYTDDGVVIGTMNLETGLMDEAVVDVYNDTVSIDGTDYQVYGMPMVGSCLGDGWFVGYDYNYDCLIIYILDYNGEGFYVLFLSDIDMVDQVGGVETYIQKMYYNPIDGMLYWAAVLDYCPLIVTDIYSGVSVITGYPGAAGGIYGNECTGLYTPYTISNTHTVEFYDGLTEELIYSVEVEDGEAAIAPDAPVHEGYTFIGWDEDFSNVTDDMIVIAQYEINSYNLTINYVDANGNVVAPAYTGTVEYNSAYSVTSPTVEGYTPNMAVVEGTMGAQDVTLAVIYTANVYTLTINYVDTEGEKLAEAYVATIAYGTAYSVPSPEIEGYTADIAVVEGTMGTADVTVTVTYTQNEQPPAGLLGDVNNDGVVDFSDASALAAYLMGGNEPEGLANADANQDHSVSIADITAIYAIIFG